MCAFKSHRSYWEFDCAVRTRTRYVYDVDVHSFLQELLATSRKREEILSSGGFLWRAQIGHDSQPIHQGGVYIDDGPVPYPPERMKPRADRAAEGRANPKGIPYLYLSTNRETALAEVRPWIGALVSVGQFKLQRELRLLNCTNEDRAEPCIFFEGEPTDDERAAAIWCDVDRSFSRPVTPSDDSAEYVPTQIIAELFKASTFDGIAYRSALGTGHNVVLFDLHAAQLMNCGLFETTNLRFCFSDVGPEYYLGDIAPTESSGAESN